MCVLITWEVKNVLNTKHNLHEIIMKLSYFRHSTILNGPSFTWLKGKKNNNWCQSKAQTTKNIKKIADSFPPIAHASKIGVQS